MIPLYELLVILCLEIDGDLKCTHRIHTLEANVRTLQQCESLARVAKTKYSIIFPEGTDIETTCRINPVMW